MFRSYLHNTVVAATESVDTDRAATVGVVIVLLVLAAAAAILWIAAAVSILRSQRYTTAGKALWILVIIALPLLGALGWFFWGRHSALTVLDSSAAHRAGQ